jgi:cell shape-determining protein MreC
MKDRLSRKRRKSRTLHSVIIFAVIIVIGLVLPRAFQIVSNLVLAPVHNLNQWLATSEDFIPALMRDRATLTSEINRLESELVINQGSALTFSRLEEENRRLRSLLSIEAEPRIAAGVIARPNNLPYDLIMIDQGYSSGISELAPVYIGTDQIIGTVARIIVSFVCLPLPALS